MKKSFGILSIVIIVVLIVTANTLMAKPEKVVIEEKNISGKTLEELKGEFKKINDERDILLLDRQNNYDGYSNNYPKQDRLNELDELNSLYEKNIRKLDMRNILEQGELQAWEESLKFSLEYNTSSELDPDGRKQLECKIGLILISKLKDSMKNKDKSNIDLYKEFEVVKQAFRASDRICGSESINSVVEGEKLLERISTQKYTISDFAKEFDIPIDKIE